MHKIRQIPEANWFGDPAPMVAPPEPERTELIAGKSASTLYRVNSRARFLSVRFSITVLHACTYLTFFLVG